MKGFISKTMTVLCLGGGLMAGPGCKTTRDLYDPCWPERYNFAARREVCQSFAPQVKNGHILQQTVYNYHFETGTDKLTAGGRDALLQLIHRRPCPDPTIYLATAQDIVYDAEAPEKFAETRCELDNRRALSIQKYLTAQTAGRHVQFHVAVHDPAEGGWDAESVDNAMRKLHTNFQGILQVQSGAGSASSSSSQ